MIRYRIILYRLRLLIMAGLLFGTLNAYSQADVTLSAPNTTGNYTATHSITLSAPFSTLGSFSAKIAAPQLFSCGSLGVPSADQNYVVTYIPRTPLTDATAVASHTSCEVVQAIQYFDGLGRLLQNVQINGNPDGTKDVIQPIAYDAFGREPTKYLPYTTGTGVTGAYRPDALNGTSGYSSSAQYSFYHPTTAQNYPAINTPLASTAFEPSPLNRVIEQGAPGDAWQLTGTVNASGVAAGHTNKIIYDTNDNTTYWAKKFGVSTNATTMVRTLVDEGSYGYNQLNVIISRNENWTTTQSDARLNTTEEYKDIEGHTVLKRTYNMNGSTFETLSTYYVYDDFGNLSFVLPPKAGADGITTASPIAQTTIDNLCYQYTYDEWNRLIGKRVPGKDWEYTVYNKLDQVVATQDGNQRLNKQWLITKYDAFGRAVITGMWNNNNTTIDQPTLKGLVYAQQQTTPWETKDNNQTYGYTLTHTYPTTLDNVLSVNYYDDYNFPAAFSPAAYAVNSQILPAMPSAQSTMTTGLPTGSLTAILNGTNNNTSTANMLWTVNYYDDKGRVIQTSAQHYLGGTVNAGNYDQISNGYDFTNAVTQSIRIHNNATNATSPAVTTIASSYVYDHVGRKRQTFENINNNATTTLISQNDYNEVGQEYIKHLHSTDGGINFLQSITYNYNERGWLRTASTDGALFNMELKYDNAPNPQYNGNIGQMNYLTTHVANPGSRSFNYTYDALNRLTNAAFSGGQPGDALDETISYDVLGNITQLVRSGAGAGILNYTNYTGNQLNTVTGYSPRSYSYDANGNATNEGGSKGISYNLLNLPQAVTQGTTTLATYTYDASGNKLRNTGSDGSWDYVNGIVYHNNTISFVNTEEGRAALNSGVYNYEYNLKDHLGNTRVSIDQYGGSARVIQEDEYYSFGLRKPTNGYDLSNNNRYLYNGKEVQTDLVNQYDYGARFYDPVIGRWTTVDPSSEEGDQESLTPYQYGLNNPVRYDDPDGRCPSCLVGGIVGGIVDYGEQVATNYVQGNKNPWTSNINLVSIGTAALAGAATSGASVVENLAAKTAIKVTAKVGAALINNTVEVNTTDGVKVHNVKDALKNTTIDLVADGVAGKVGGKVQGALSKVGVTNAGRLSSTARAAVRATGSNVTRATTATVKAGLKVATKVVAQTTESTIKATTNKKRDELKKNTNTGN